MENLCLKCDKRPTCKVLCAKALKYADQDWVRTENMITGRPKHEIRHIIFNTSWVESISE